MQRMARWVCKKCLGRMYLCQVCDVLLALLAELSPLGKALLSRVCSLPCCGSNLQLASHFAAGPFPNSLQQVMATRNNTAVTQTCVPYRLGNGVLNNQMSGYLASYKNPSPFYM